MLVEQPLNLTLLATVFPSRAEELPISIGHHLVNYSRRDFFDRLDACSEKSCHHSSSPGCCCCCCFFFFVNILLTVLTTFSISLSTKVEGKGGGGGGSSELPCRRPRKRVSLLTAGDRQGHRLERLVLFNFLTAAVAEFRLLFTSRRLDDTQQTVDDPRDQTQSITNSKLFLVFSFLLFF